ncbi:MAG: cobyrinate a,c-diamide synthase, partial [Planctomycetota bacterium]
MRIPRILIAGMRGGGGKTLTSLGLVAAWRKQGLSVAPFKKGPDYIDAAWLSKTANKSCRNLDLFLMSPHAVVRSFVTAAEGADVAVIEGNRGLYDGMDAQGTYSTAELAKLLEVPVVLVVDCTKTSRTVAAFVLGCQRLDPQVAIRGVILNQTAGPRHESVLREAVEPACGVPVLGAVARIPEELFPERHLGLVPPEEHEEQARSIQQVAAVAEQYLDLKALWNVAREAPALEGKGVRTVFPERPEGCRAQEVPDPFSPLSPQVARIGVCRDAAFQFYYPENLEALAREGASLIEVSPLGDVELPEVDALYIGGGFPEVLAPALAKNKSFLDSLRRRIDQGLPVYAECGGAVFLGEKLVFEEKEYAMAGVLPVVFVFREKPQGHGYAVLETVQDNPFYSVGESLRGHEFHYTSIEPSRAKDLRFAFRVRRGYGFDGQHDGLCSGNVLASYTHVHALGTEIWAPSLVRAAVRFR